MAADDERGVVLVAEHPVDLLGKPRRHGCREDATGLEHAGQFAERGDVVLDVFEHLRGDDAVERGVGERQLRRVAANGASESQRVDFSSHRHRGEGVASRRDFVVAVVESDDGGAAAGGFVGVATEPGAGVKKQRLGRDRQTVEADGQHGSAGSLCESATHLFHVVGHRQHLAVLVDRQ